MKSSLPKLTEPQVMAALREKFEPPAFAFLEQVRNGTGWQRETRTADALAMSTWPSRGLGIHGFEVKVARSDWKRELENPQKAEEIFKFCDFWWLVVGSEEIVQPGELPPTWGLMVPGPKGLKVKVEAPALNPDPISRPFLASILRNMTAADERTIQAQINKRVEETRTRERETLEQIKKASEGPAQTKLKELNETLDRFAEASGIDLRDGWKWEAGKIGHLVRLLLDADKRTHLWRIEEAERSLRSLADEMKAAHAELKQLGTHKTTTGEAA